MPFIWNQIPTLSYKPIPQVKQPLEENVKSYKQHYKNLLLRYNKVYSVNLIDKKGKVELPLGNLFGKFHQQCLEDVQGYKGNVDYTWFDYHKECKGMKIENLLQLVKEMEGKLDEYGYFDCQFYYKNGQIEEMSIINR